MTCWRKPAEMPTAVGRNVRWDTTASTVAAALLPVVEEIDPTLVDDCHVAGSLFPPASADRRTVALVAAGNQ